MANGYEPTIEQAPKKINAETSDLNPRVMCTSKSSKKNQSVVKDAGVLMSRCNGPRWLIRQFVGREKPCTMMQFHVDFAVAEVVRMSLEDG